MSEMKAAGLNVKTDIITTGATRYSITAPGCKMVRAKMFA